MKNVLVPWKMPHYQAINGFHPLFSGLVERRGGLVDYVFPDPDEAVQKPDLDHVTGVVAMEACRVGGRFSQLAEDQSRHLMNYLGQYIETRDMQAQARIYACRERADLVFHHTTPLHLSEMPFVMHFESVTTLFYPFLLHGYNKSVDLRRELIFHMIKSRLESDECRAIFTHIKESARVVERSFASDRIAAKLHYIPLGVDLPASLEERVNRKLAGGGVSEGLNILFTNSAHGAGTSFLLRGGHDLLMAFQRHRQTFPSSVLTLVTSGREAFEQVHPNLMHGVRWIEQGIDDQELFELLLQADVFALPAAGLHSYSVLRAMRCGAVLIGSDAPGYDEFIEDGRTALVVKGRRAQVYDQEAETGWWRDDYGPMHQFSMPVIEQLAGMLDDLAARPDHRLDLARQAYGHVRNHHAIEPWVASVEQLLARA